MTPSATSAQGSPLENATAGGREDAAANATQFSRSLRNVLWLSSGSVLTRLMNVVRGIILARLLAPFDFGVYGLAGSIVGIKERFIDIGAGTFLVYRPKQVEEHTETAFWVNLGLSTFLLAVLAVVAPLLAKLYRTPLLAPVLVVLALGIWARANASVHQSLLRAHSRFRALAIIDYCNSAAWLAVAVLLAWKGFGVWALVVSASAANALTAALLVAAQGWRPRFQFSKASLRLLVGFSFWYLWQGLAWFLVGNLDNLLVGRFLGMTLLGIYTLAFNYALLPVTLIGNAIGSVAYAELPRLYDRPESFWSAFLEFSRVEALVACGAAFAALVIAPEAFPLVFGHKWDAAIVPFQILCVYAAIRCLWLDPFLALGNFRLSSLTGLACVVVEVGAIGFGLRYGLAGVACAMAAVQAALSATTLRLVSPSWRTPATAARNSLPYFAGAAAAAAAGLAVRRLFLGSLAEWIVALRLAGSLGTYTILFWFLFRGDLKALLRQVRDRQPGGASL